MQSLATAIEAYMTDSNKAPDVAAADALVPLLVPTYSSELRLRDGWDTPLRYVRTGAQSFRIVSAGADREFDEKSWGSPLKTADLNADAVFAGQFERIWTDASGEALVLSDEEAQAAVKPFVDAELEKMKAMTPEQSMSYLRTSSTNLVLDSLAAALEAYKRKHGRYPVASTIDGLEKALYPEFMAEVPRKDRWGTELRYVSSKDGRRYQLISAGADKAFDDASWRKGRGVLSVDDEDAVVENGEAVRYWDQTTRPGAGPEGAARKALQPAARTHLERADERVAASDFAGALESYMEAVKADHNAADLERLRRYNPTFVAPNARQPYVAALRQHLDIHASDMEALRELAGLLEQKEAEDFLTPLIETRPREAELYALRATARAKAGQWRAALDDYEKARDLDPYNAQRHYITGVVAYEMATKDVKLSTKEKEELIRRGITALERAERFRDDYFEAMVYRSLLMREQAGVTSDPAAKAKLIADADALRERAKTLVSAKRQQAAPAPVEEPPPATNIPGAPFRVGGDVKAPIVISRVEPVYPDEAKPHRIAGIVILEVIIDRNGRVVDAKALKDLPYGAGQAAIDAVRQWTFRPGTLQDQPVDVLFNLTVNIRPPN